ncbi:unnamed protein product [Ranitomeya imitator]|uniref:Uncharacterized protein n=1 Tax=Ranitomeya imitator TaxID=111125 RepID=A0ABN9KST1_9NEOB|nr:unnamed protein product [Ranitomeya imitator]
MGGDGCGGHTTVMSKKEEGSKPLHPTAAEQLVKCYGADHSGKPRKTETKHVISCTYSDSSTLSHLSISRHLEQRLRPQSCAACRACVSSSLTNSTPLEVLNMQPLLQTHRLPYHCAKSNKESPKARNKTRMRSQVAILLQLPHCKNLVSCNGKRSGSDRGLTSSGSSRLSEEQVPSLPCLPTLPQTGLQPTRTGNTGDGYNTTYHPDPELRQWIAEFGGDEQAAFMARGLQKLQLAYETGRAEMNQSTQCKPATER